jgi:hypothetical protein
MTEIFNAMEKEGLFKKRRIVDLKIEKTGILQSVQYIGGQLVVNIQFEDGTYNQYISKEIDELYAEDKPLENPVKKG